MTQEIIDNITKELLDKNYDTSILDTKPTHIQNIIKDYSAKIITKYFRYSNPSEYTKFNIPMALSVINHYNRIQPKVSNISGAGKLVYLVDNETNMKVYIFFDYTHSLENSCPSKSKDIADYFYKIFSVADRFIDFYGEFGPTTEYANDSYLRRIHRRLKNCSEGENKRLSDDDCFQNVRIHYIDTRNLGDVNHPVEKIRYTSSFTEEERQHYIHNIQKYFNVMFSKETFNRYIEKIVKLYVPVKKEMSKLDPKIYNIIMKFILEYQYEISINELANYSKNTGYNGILEIFSAYKKKIEDGTFPGNRESNKSNHSLDDYLHIFIIIDSFIMDIYTLARIFKKHDDEFTYFPSSPKNIIIYAGSAHSALYYKFFNYLGYSTKYDKTFTNYKSCIDLSDLPQPLFG